MHSLQPARSGQPPRRIAAHGPGVPFDLETTGIDVRKDRIVQWAAIRRAPDGGTTEHCMLVNPGRPIPNGASRVHGIYDQDVQQAPPWADVAPQVWACMHDAEYWLGHNIKRFDVPLLRHEMARAGYEMPETLLLDTYRMLNWADTAKQAPDHKLTTAYQFFTGKDLDQAHDALADARASMIVGDALVATYPDRLRDPTPQGLAKI